MISNFPLTAIIIINPDWFEALSQLPRCLKSVDWCSHRLIASSYINPELISIAKEYHAELIHQSGTNFAEWRNHAVTQVHTAWVFFIDADEQVTEELKLEVKDRLSHESRVAGYAIPRLNYILGRPMRYGGWWPDYVLRIFETSKFLGYQGAVHEQPELSGPVQHLISSLKHYKHPDLEDMVTKTSHWSDTEARLLFSSHHPPMHQYRFLRPFARELISRLFLKLGFLDRTEGLIDAIYQSYSRFITYAKLWEIQQKIH